MYSALKTHHTPNVVPNFMKTLTTILTILTLTLTSFLLTDNSDDFKTKVENFIAKYSTDYATSPETLDGTGYQWTLDTKTRPTWTTKQTLKSKEPFINKYDQTAYQRLFFAFYQYDTEEKGKIALDSLTNCFPPLCLKIQRDKNKEGTKAIPAIYLITKTEIVTCHLHCEQIRDNWTEITKDIIKTFGDQESVIITTGCGGPLEWTKKE